MKLTVITPAFNEQDCIEPFVGRIVPVLEALPASPSWNVIFVDNGSSDETYERLLALHGRDSRFRLLRLSRNFGYQGALCAGLTEADGDVFVFIDIDNEDPPELIGDFWERFREGYQVIYGIRSDRDEPSWLILCRRMFYLINGLISDFGAVQWMAEFGMFTADVRGTLLRQQTSFRFLRSEIAALGFARIGVPYRRARRTAGRTHYNLYGATKFAVAGMLASSTLPLRLAIYLAPVFLIAFVLAVGCLSGIDRLVAALSVMFGYQVVTIPFIAVYLARTYKNTVGFPLFVVDRSRSHV